MIKGIKICGISDLETLMYILNHKNRPKFVGFICNYKKSKRYVDYKKLIKLVNIKKRDVNFVCVLVKPSIDTLKKIKNLNFDYYQLYDVDPKETKIIKEKYNIKITQADKGFFYSFGLIEGFETICFFLFICLFPNVYANAAYIFFTLTLLTHVIRVFKSFKRFL